MTFCECMNQNVRAASLKVASLEANILRQLGKIIGDQENNLQTDAGDFGQVHFELLLHNYM